MYTYLPTYKQYGRHRDYEIVTFLNKNLRWFSVDLIKFCIPLRKSQFHLKISKTPDFVLVSRYPDTQYGLNTKTVFKVLIVLTSANPASECK